MKKVVTVHLESIYMLVSHKCTCIYVSEKLNVAGSYWNQISNKCVWDTKSTGTIPLLKKPITLASIFSGGSEQLLLN